MQSCNEGAENKMKGNPPEINIPAVVKTSFNKKYPDATNADWETEKENGKLIYEVEFKMNGNQMKAEFDEAGNFIREING